MSEKLTVYTDNVRGTIDPMVYGHFIEHLSHCIYDGIWVGTDSSIPNIDGIREEAVNMLRDVNAPLIRWPGGYFAEYYDWRDGIGPREKRPLRFNNHQVDNEESNAFGTHEFMQLCALTGAEPNLCVNVPTHSPQVAQDWVEYCNCDGRTTFAQMRKDNGQAEPWRVKYWAVGNESYWRHRPQDYVQRFLLWRRAMKRADPDIQCIASLIQPTWHPKPFSPHDDWLQDVIAGIRDNMELASFHIYSEAGHGLDFSTADYWDLMNLVSQFNRLRIESFLGAIDSVVGHRRIKLALDEWGIWHPHSNFKSDRHEQPATHRDAIFAARIFHLLQEYPNRIALATIAQTFNVLQALLRTRGPRTYRTPTFHVFEMFKGHQGGQALECLHTSPRREIENKTVVTKDDHIRNAECSDMIVTEEDTLKVVTASVSRSPDNGKILVSLTNADLEKTQSYDIDFVGSFTPATATARVLTADPHAQNSFDEPEAVTSRDHPVKIADGKVSLDLPPCSVVAVHLKS